MEMVGAARRLNTDAPSDPAGHSFSSWFRHIMIDCSSAGEFRRIMLFDSIIKNLIHNLTTPT
jgi:hypothetical protein